MHLSVRKVRSQKSWTDRPRTDSDFHLAQVQMAALVLGCRVSGFAGGFKHAKKKKILDFSEGNLENLAGIFYYYFFWNKQIEQSFEDLILLRTHCQHAEMGARELLG